MVSGALRETRGAYMKPADWIVLLPAVNNGWSFAAFVIVVLVSLYLSRRVP